MGLNYFSKIKEINKTFDRFEKSPKDFIENYYNIQISEITTDLYSENYSIRTNAIKKLSLNPFLENKHIDL